MSQLSEAQYDKKQLPNILDELENVIIEDVVRSSDASPEAHGHVKVRASILPSVCLALIAKASHQPSVSAGEVPLESLIQSTSLSLLPHLLRFPTLSSTAASSLLSLALIVAERGNPKELWLAIEGALEGLRCGVESFEGDQDALESQYAQQFARLLVIARVGMHFCLSF